MDDGWPRRTLTVAPSANSGGDGGTDRQGELEEIRLGGDTIGLGLRYVQPPTHPPAFNTSPPPFFSMPSHHVPLSHVQYHPSHRISFPR